MTTVPATSDSPFRRSEPAAGSVAMRTPASAWPSTGSLKPKSAATSTRGPSSTSTRVPLVPVGAVLTGRTVSVTTFSPDQAWPSPAR